MKTINTEIVTVDTVIAEGKYTWNKGENDIEFHGALNGYSMGFCIEVQKADGTFAYSSVIFLNNWDKFDTISLVDSAEDDYWSLDHISSVADMCLHDGNKVTGRLVFRGYFTEQYDVLEREEYFIDASAEVEEMWSTYVSGEVV